MTVGASTTSNTMSNAVLAATRPRESGCWINAQHPHLLALGRGFGGRLAKTDEHPKQQGDHPEHGRPMVVRRSVSNGRARGMMNSATTPNGTVTSSASPERPSILISLRKMILACCKKLTRPRPSKMVASRVAKVTASEWETKTQAPPLSWHCSMMAGPGRCIGIETGLCFIEEQEVVVGEQEPCQVGSSTHTFRGLARFAPGRAGQPHRLEGLYRSTLTSRDETCDELQVLFEERSS